MDNNQNVRKRGRGHFYFKTEKNETTTTNKAGPLTMESTDSKSLNKNAGLLTMESTDSKTLNKTAGLMTMEPTGSQKPKSTTHTSVEEEEAFQKIMEEANEEERSRRIEILKVLFSRPGTDDSVVGGDILRDLKRVKIKISKNILNYL
ncbi:unnamed protein product [Meloidogyne enterolobii]|uniref:Uncharacterized protein n=1 Tax=Meloidogyne enterolobii TaxID=390850 RepID=A0ACB1AIB6_MELEN